MPKFLKILLIFGVFLLGAEFSLMAITPPEMTFFGPEMLPERQDWLDRGFSLEEFDTFALEPLSDLPEIEPVNLGDLLIEAVKKDNLLEMEYLIQHLGVDVNKPIASSLGLPPIYVALINHQFDAALMLFKAGADMLAGDSARAKRILGYIRLMREITHEYIEIIRLIEEFWPEAARDAERAEFGDADCMKLAARRGSPSIDRGKIPDSIEVLHGCETPGPTPAPETAPRGAVGGGGGGVGDADATDRGDEEFKSLPAKKKLPKKVLSRASHPPPPGDQSTLLIAG